MRSHLQSLGISLRSATEPIDDTSTGKLMEGVLAAFAQFDNDVRSDRTRAGVQEALRPADDGHSCAPIGYINVPRTYGKSLIPDPERAPVVQQIFARLRHRTIHQARAVGADNDPSRAERRGKGLPVSSQAFATHAARTSCTSASWTPLATAFVGKRGDFDPLIPDDVFYRVQAILTGRVHTTGPYQRRRPEFPLARVHQVCGVRTRRHGELVEGTQRAIRATTTASHLAGR